MSNAVHSTNSIADRADALRPFACSWSKAGLDAAWVRVAGALDLDATPQLKQTLLESQSTARLVVLDLSELSFIDLAGARAIVNASNHARLMGRRLVLIRGRAKVDHVLKLAASADTVDIADVHEADPAASNRFSVRSSLPSSVGTP